MVKLVGKIPTDIRLNDVRSNDSNQKKLFLLHLVEAQLFNGSITIIYVFKREATKNMHTWKLNAFLNTKHRALICHFICLISDKLHPMQLCDAFNVGSWARLCKNEKKLFQLNAFFTFYFFHIERLLWIACNKWSRVIPFKWCQLLANNNETSKTRYVTVAVSIFIQIRFILISTQIIFHRQTMGKCFEERQILFLLLNRLLHRDLMMHFYCQQTI